MKMVRLSEKNLYRHSTTCLVVALAETEESVLTGKVIIISGDPSMEKQEEFLRMTINTLFCRTHLHSNTRALEREC